jgi:hypothetical protein
MYLHLMQFSVTTYVIGQSLCNPPPARASPASADPIFASTLPLGPFVAPFKQRL